MGNFFINGYDLYAEIKKDPEAFLLKIVTAASFAGVTMGNDMSEAVNEVIVSRSYEEASDVCKRILTMLDGTIAVRPDVKKE